MTTFSFLAMAHFLLDLFGIISDLSKTLQSNRTIFSTAISAIQNTLIRIECLSNRPVPNGYLHNLLSNIAAHSENFEFQGVPIINVPTDVQTTQVSSLPTRI